MMSTPARTPYDAARRDAGVIDRSGRGRIVVSGQDRASYLQGLLTNDIVALKPGQGCYASYLTAQGRMLADLLVYELGDILLLTMSGSVRAAVLARLEQFIFSEDVQLGDVTDTFAQLAVVGPRAAAVAGAVLDGGIEPALATLPEHGNVRAAFGGQPAIVARVTDTGVPGFDLFVDRREAGRLGERLRQAGAVPIDEPTADILRIEAGVPRFGPDMDEDTIPLEAGIEGRAISFTKGCYVGQEVIIRVLHRGHGRVAKRLVGLSLDGEAPSTGATILDGGREIGRVTSAAFSPALARAVALGYVHRDFVEPGTVVSVDGRRATVTALPFVEAPA